MTVIFRFSDQDGVVDREMVGCPRVGESVTLNSYSDSDSPNQKYQVEEVAWVSEPGEVGTPIVDLAPET